MLNYLEENGRRWKGHPRPLCSGHASVAMTGAGEANVLAAWAGPTAPIRHVAEKSTVQMAAATLLRRLDGL